MSEYQYYEFQAIDRPLTDDEQKTLRRYSGRAMITATRFVNSCSYGDFRGDESEWMAKYFDAFLYIANWGTHRSATAGARKQAKLHEATPGGGAAVMTSDR